MMSDCPSNGQAKFVGFRVQPCWTAGFKIQRGQESLIRGLSIAEEGVGLDNSYHSLTIDLAATTPAVDVVYDYENVADLIQAKIAWRRYRIDLADALPVTDSGEPDLISRSAKGA